LNPKFALHSIACDCAAEHAGLYATRLRRIEMAKARKPRPGEPPAVTEIEVRIMRLPHAADLPLPAHQSTQAGFDLMAAVPGDAPVIIAPGGRGAIPTGVVFAPPPGIEGQVRPRPGLALLHGFTASRCSILPARLIPDYRGEVQVILANLGHDPFVVERGPRIAQLVLVASPQAAIREVGLDEITRGAAAKHELRAQEPK
jgi:dUTP pyrophosphatase